MSEEISTIPKDGEIEEVKEEVDSEETTRKEINIKPTMPDKPRIDRVQQLKDLAKLDLMKPVKSRMMKRYKEILEMSRAKSTKIMKGLQPVWTTVPPQMFISGLKLVTKNGVGTITYHRYKTDKDGNKEYKEQYKQVVNSSGDKVNIPVSGYYVMECLVVETIEYMKPLKVEEITEFV